MCPDKRLQTSMCPMCQSHLATRPLIWQRDVDELVQPPGPQQRPIDDVGAVGGSDDEDGLLAVHAVHFGQQLVKNAVARATGVTGAAPALHGDGVELVEEQDAGCGAAGLVKDLADVGL